MSKINLPFFSDLLPASYWGIPFGVSSVRANLGQKVAIHEYPSRDGVRVENMGQKGTKYFVQGFLVQDAAYGGVGDVIAQRLLLETALELPLAGPLILPSRQLVKANLIEYECSESFEEGRVFRLSFVFVTAGLLEFASSLLNASAASVSAGIDVATASASDFIKGIGS